MQYSTFILNATTCLLMATFTGSCGPEYSPFENAIYHKGGGYSQFQNDSLGYHAENAEKMVSLGESYSNICDSIVDESERQAPIFSLANLQRRFLELHNRDRRRFGLDDLVWDTNLANYAQRWANYLKENHGCEMRHRSQLGETEGKSYGENLAFYWTSQNLPQGTFGSTPDLAVNSWDAECADYDLVSNSCSVGKVCGHFTQVVWEKSKRVGCAVATCNAGDKNYNRAGRAEVWVCNYDPPGNMSISHGGVITKLKPFSEIVRKPTGSDEGSMAEDEPQSLPAIGSKSSSRVVLYGNPGCIFCQMSEEALKKEGIQYEFNNINADVQLRNKIVNDVGPQRYPYVFVDGKYIGGLPELQAMINNKELSANAGPSLARPPEKISDLKPPPVPAFEPVGRSGTLGKSAKRVVLYGNPGCGLCKAAESLLSDNGISYDFNNVWQDNALLQRLHNEIGAQRFPYVFVDGKHVGGLSELQAMLANKELDKKPVRPTQEEPITKPVEPVVHVAKPKPAPKPVEPPVCAIKPGPDTKTSEPAVCVAKPRPAPGHIKATIRVTKPLPAPKPATTTLGRSAKNVVLYGNPNCGLCKTAENLLNEKAIPYDFVDIWTNKVLLQQLHQEIGPQKFPYVFIGGKHVGGLQELVEMINKNKLAAKPEVKPRAMRKKPEKKQPTQMERRKVEPRKTISASERARLLQEARKRRAKEQLFRK